MDFIYSNAYTLFTFLIKLWSKNISGVYSMLEISWKRIPSNGKQRRLSYT